MARTASQPSPAARARAALGGADFRRLFGIRLSGQCGDGFFQAALVASVVFAPTDQSTTVGLFIAALLTALPFSILGPFVGVFIDRWPRRTILRLSPFVKVALVGLVLFDPQAAALPFYLGALGIFSINRFYLASASAVVPRVVATEHLLVANSLATVGGTLSLLVGVFAGGHLAEATDSSVPSVAIAAVLWLVASWFASRIRSDLAPMTLPSSPELLRHQVRRVFVEFRQGASTLIRTQRAIGPISSITLDQIGQGLILTLALVVFREEFGEGVGSFSNVIGAGGVGVLAGIATVGLLEDRASKDRIVAGAFMVGGVALIATALTLSGPTILAGSFAVGLTFAWKKVPVDTLVQESLPDGYRGRVFSVYDVFYNLARVLAAGIAIPLFPAVGTRWSVAIVGLAFIAWTPVLPRWISRQPEIRLEFPEGDAAHQWPRAVRWGAAHETVEVLRSWDDERGGTPRRCFRLQLQDGTELDVCRSGPEGDWEITRERDD
jgi:predicted MFS family arabinose efflux permease